MSSSQASLLPPEPYSRELEQHVESRLGRRVRGLRVEVLQGRIVLTGQATSYYVKQLAQHCVWDVMPEAQLENAIVVQPQTTEAPQWAAS